MPQLRNDDRLAVDLLLDRAVTGSTDGRPGGFTAASGAAPQQVSQVQAVLRVLDMMPAEEPPADLVARTMRRVDAQTAHDPAALRPPQPVADMQMPHA